MIDIHTIAEAEQFIEQNEMAFVYISQPDCSVCHALLPKVQTLLMQYPMIQNAHINAAEVLEVAEKFSVFTVPVLLLFIEGKEMLRKARFVSIDELDESIGKMYHMFYN